MATIKERSEFLCTLVREFPGKPVAEVMQLGNSLLRHARTHGNLAVELCNGPEHLNRPAPYDWKKQPDLHAAWQKRNSADMEAWELDQAMRRERCDKRIREVCAELGVSVTLGGDPRGATVKIKLPSGLHNTWGGIEDGYAVPS